MLCIHPSSTEYSCLTIERLFEYNQHNCFYICHKEG
jgi:hypothetical protein